MAYTDVQICNLALSKVRGGVINALDEGSAASDACNLIYAPMRDEIIQLRPWASCTKRTTLAQIDPAPAFEWTYAYQLPGDFLSLIRLGSDPNTIISYSIEGTALLTNEATAPIIYSYRNEDPATYEAMLVELIASRMAIDLAFSVAGSATMRTALAQEFELKRQRAKAVDGQAVSQPNFTMTTFVEARQ